MIDELTKCVRCGVECEYFAAHEIQWFWRRTIFKYMQHYHPKIFNESGLCVECAKYITPFIYGLLDIAFLDFDINKLQRSIYEKQRNQNNRTA
jgi:recombinational DNA repair protein (RecF pathway)